MNKVYYIQDVTEKKELLSYHEIQTLLKEMIKEKRISDTYEIKELMYHIKQFYYHKYNGQK